MQQIVHKMSYRLYRTIEPFEKQSKSASNFTLHDFKSIVTSISKDAKVFVTGTSIKTLTNVVETTVPKQADDFILGAFYTDMYW